MHACLLRFSPECSGMKYLWSGTDPVLWTSLKELPLTGQGSAHGSSSSPVFGVFFLAIVSHLGEFGKSG